jgi:hypothetical protein
MAVAKMAVLRPLAEILLLGVVLAPPLFLWAQNSSPSASSTRVHSELWHFDGKFVVRGEFRQDFSEQNTFRESTGFTNRQFTTAANLIYLF